jgi:Rod binding domain-containing protein
LNSVFPPSSSLSQARPPIDRRQVPDNVRQAAEGMEAMFIDTMIRTMRQSVPNSEYSLSNSATEIYQSQLDSEHAQKAVQSGGFGLADQIIAYLMSDRYNQKVDKESTQPVNQAQHGGSHESRTTTRE